MYEDDKMSSWLMYAEKQTSLIPKAYKWIPDNLHYEVIMGSYAYGVNTPQSDYDIYGWCIPPKTTIFPHLTGRVPGFGPSIEQKFDVWSKAHVVVEDNVKSCDFAIYNIVKYFSLVAENNPNMIDSLFVPHNCITHITSAGQILRDNRHSFLNKNAYHKFRGYAASQIHKIKTKNTPTNSARQELIEKFGYDVKFAYHCIRLLQECMQILIYCDIDLQKDRELLKSIRRGELSLDDLIELWKATDQQLVTLFAQSKLPDQPDYERLNTILLNILEQHYGSLSFVPKEDRTQQLVNEVTGVLQKYR